MIDYGWVAYTIFGTLFGALSGAVVANVPIELNRIQIFSNKDGS
jgi:hypothetical protein